MSVQQLQIRLAKRLRWQKQAYRLEHADRTLAAQLSGLRRWQARRLAGSFAHFMRDPKKRPAAEFFLTDLYGDADFMRRDEEAAKILPAMARILPTTLLHAAVDSVELSVLSHAMDMRMARQLAAMGVLPDGIDTGTYAQAYRRCGLRRLRTRQIDLVLAVGRRLDAVIHVHGIGKLLSASRVPARLLGLSHLQGFLERGFSAFSRLDGADQFLEDIHRQETCIARRLREGHARPFDPPFS